MKAFRMADIEKIEEMLVAEKTVEVEWKDGATGEMNTETVKSVRWDSLVFTTGSCIYTGIDRLKEIREVAYEDDEDEAERHAIENGYDGVVICDADTMHIECY